MVYFRSEEKWQKDLIKQLAKEFKLDVRVVRALVYYPMLYTRRRQADPVSEVPVRVRHLGVWTLKSKRHKRKNVTNL